MNADQFEGKWKQFKGQVREKWGKLTDDDLHLIAGRREELIGKVQERYGIAKEKATHEVDEYVKALNNSETGDRRDLETAEPRESAKHTVAGRG
jgi:uncharacterized protein YjbJ (UPF0337 family)